MSDQLLLDRISCDPSVMLGKPVIKDTRLTVDYILNQLGHGATTQEILDQYQGLREEDIQACLLFAAQLLSSTTFMPLRAKSA